MAPYRIDPDEIPAYLVHTEYDNVPYDVHYTTDDDALLADVVTENDIIIVCVVDCNDTSHIDLDTDEARTIIEGVLPEILKAEEELLDVSLERLAASENS